MARGTREERRPARGAALAMAIGLSWALVGPSAAQTAGDAAAAGDCPSAAEVERLRRSVEDLSQQQRQEMVNMARTLAAERDRTDALLAEVETIRAHQAVGTACRVPADAAQLALENARLRADLEAERRHAAALEAKLKTVDRVTDLVFRMRGRTSAGVTSTSYAH